MRNFNSLFNTVNMTRSTFPFATAGSSIASKSASTGFLAKTAGSKITLSGILNGAQKTIGTVNQIVPLYNQIKPMFQNSKILLNVARGIKSTNLTPKRNFYRQKTINDVKETIDVKVETKEEIKKEKSSKNEPSKPFFL